MAELFDISKWEDKNWYQTGGTRQKKFVENLDNSKEYFFKESIERYPSEFWSEIIASKVGNFLGFDVLDYNIGLIGHTLGCICQSMIDRTNQELEHGVQLIKQSNPEFKISTRPSISFDQIIKSFNSNQVFIDKFIDILVFDAIIGNQDRHSENWAFIRSLKTDNTQSMLKNMVTKSYEVYKRQKFRLPFIPFRRSILNYMRRKDFFDIHFSPIYDSGSSLGRDIHDSKIADFLNDDLKIHKYIDKGLSEIRWKVSDEKINHFELLKNVKQLYPDRVSNTVNMVLNNYKSHEIENIINQIDRQIPEFIDETHLSLQRKELIAKFIDFRIKRLESIKNK